MTDQADHSQAWRNALLAMTLATLWLIAAYWPTAAAMVEIWARSGTFTHAFLVPPISVWLIWRLRDALTTIAPQPTPWLGVPLVLAALLWLLGELAAVNVVTQFALVAMVVLCVPMLFGWRLTRAIMFPLAFLFFAVPFGEFIMPRLMSWTANITVMGVRLSGVPVYQEGLQFVIPTGHWSVVEACSGVRYLIASICIGVLFAYLNYQSWQRRLLFVAASIVVPLIANWVRAYGIVMLGHFSGNQLATGVDHLVYGWVFFGIVITLLFMVGMRWQEPEKMPVFASPTGVRQATRPLLPSLVLALLTMSLAPAALWLIERGNAQTPPRFDAAMLAQIDGWQLAAAASHGWQPAFANPSAVWSGSFRRGEQQVEVYIGYYRQQNYQRKLISSSNALVHSGDTEWALVAQGTQMLMPSATTARTAQLRSGVVGAGGERRLQVWQWYWIDGNVTSSDFKGKLLTTLARLRGHGDDGAVVVLSALEGQMGGAEGALNAFTASAGTAVHAMLHKTQEQR